METPLSPTVIWNSSTESLIKSLGEKALSLSWLHSRSEKRYSYLNNFLAIPAIILSSITATIGGTFAGDKTFAYVTTIASTIVAVITTLNSYFSYAKRAESHRITAINYSKLYLQINIELSLPRAKRMNVKDFLKVVSEQIQRLNEVQPSIPDATIMEYNSKFKDEPSTIAKPECCNGLVDIKIYLDEPVPIAPPPSPIVNITLEPPRELKEPPKKSAFK
jgi:hypothetical protein